MHLSVHRNACINISYLKCRRIVNDSCDIARMSTKTMTSGIEQTFIGMFSNDVNLKYIHTHTQQNLRRYSSIIMAYNCFISHNPDRT